MVTTATRLRFGRKADSLRRTGVGRQSHGGRIAVASNVTAALGTYATIDLS